MIDLNNAVPIVRQKLEKLEVGGAIELKTYKRDRGVTIIKNSDDSVRIIETGYEDKEFQIPESKVKKILKIILKKEFPRSKKVRLKVIPG